MRKSRVKTRILVTLIMSAALISDVGAVTVEQFGESIARTLQDGDGERFATFLDKQNLAERALSGMQGNDEFIARLRTDLEQNLSRVGTIMVNNLGPSAKLTCLRVRTMEGVTRVLVRIDLGDRGLNYMEFFVHKRPDDSWALFDSLDYVQGQMYTESLKMAMALMMRDKPSLMSQLFGLPDVDKKLVAQIAELGALGQKGEWARWIEVYHTLPANIRKSRVLLATRIVAANLTGTGDEYMNAMADLHTHYGDDPTLSLILVDYYLLKGDYTRAYRAVDRLVEYTGGDAALTSLRSGIALHKRDNAASIRYARDAISEDATYEDPYWNLMLAGSRAGEFTAAMQGVRELEDRFGYEFSADDLKESEDFSELVASKEWQSGGLD
jgi:tetratricopeptide (TPR) repeat protein